MYQKHLQSGIATFTVSNIEQKERNSERDDGRCQGREREVRSSTFEGITYIPLPSSE